MSDPRTIIVTMWLLGIVLVSYRSVQQTRDLPAPHDMVAVCVVYSLLVLLGEFAAPLAAVLAVGYIAMLGISSSGLLNPPVQAQPSLASAQKQPPAQPQPSTPSTPSQGTSNLV